MRIWKPREPLVQGSLLDRLAAESKSQWYLGLVVALHAEYIMRKAGLEEAQAGIKIARRNINNLRYAGDTTLIRGTKRPLDESERGE